MKKQWLTALGVLAAALLALSAYGASFDRVNIYADGQFSDVENTAWYAGSVSSAFELGFMKGTADAVFSPTDNMTLAEAITIASRVHDAYTGGGAAFDQSAGDNWYDCYVDYAAKNGIIGAGDYADYDRNARRHEMASIFAHAVPPDFLTAINDVREVPDVPATNAYAGELLSLYRAGVMLGNDGYGTFLPNNDVTRAEAAAIIERVALPEKRLQRALVDANVGDAYYLIYDMSARYAVTDLGNGIISSWNVDNRTATVGGGAGIADISPEDAVKVWRDVEDVTEGLVGLDLYANLGNAASGAFFTLSDDEENAVFSLTTKDGKFFVNGNDTGAAVPTVHTYIRALLDLDAKTAALSIDGNAAGTYMIGDFAVGRMDMGSDKEGTAAFSVDRVALWRNYLVNDGFLAPVGAPTPEWTVTGGKIDVVHAGGQTYNDYNSAKIAAGTTAYRPFRTAFGKIVAETYVYLGSENDAAKVALRSESMDIAKVILNKDGVFTAGGEKLRFLNPGIWQTVRMEIDTVNQQVLYRINGKAVGTYPIVTPVAMPLDGIAVTATAGDVIFDDVTVQMVHDYDDYCPAPVPVGEDDGYDVILNICSLWREGTHSGWGAVSAYDDIEPALGYYDEGLVETADWELKFWRENGIDVAHFCWYAPSNAAEPIKRSNLNFALHDGYFNAKYSDTVKFTFMWENSGGGGAPNLEAFKKYIWNYWMDYYFLDPRFYTIDNKLVFTVWSVDKFRDSFGGTVEGAEEAIAFMNEDAKAHGFDGVMIFFADGHQTSASGLKMRADYGGDAAYAYHWQQDGTTYDRTVNRLQGNANYGVIHIVPTVSVGFNNIGWSGVRKPLISVADHKKVLNYIKNEYLPGYEGWKARTLVVSTWNEYGEGTYVMPCKGLHGFAYLENVAEVIDGVTDHSNNVYPTEQQKARLGHLYTTQKTSLERFDVEQPEKNTPTKVLYHADGVDFEPQMRTQSVDVNFSTIHVTTVETDSALRLKESKRFAPFDASEVKALRFVLRANVSAYTEIFFMTEASPSPKQENNLHFNLEKSDEYREYVVFTDQCANWTGTVTNLRFDFLNKAGEYDVQEFELLGYDDAETPPVITVGYQTLDYDFYPKWRGDELYVVADPATGFFVKHRFAYEWSRFTGKLRVIDNRDNEIVFTVGSEKALVNGKETPLAEQVALVDGIPELPLTFIYDAFGITYKREGNDISVKLSLSEADARIEEIRAHRVPYEYEFEIPGDLEGFGLSNAIGSVTDGVIRGSATKKSNGSYDPIVSHGGLTIPADTYNKVIVRMKHKLPEGMDGTHIELFFGTQAESGLDQVKAMALPVSGNASDDFVEYAFNISENAKWVGTVTTLRIDPIGNAGEFEIDCIRVVHDDAVEQAKLLKIQEMLERGLVIENGDAEGDDDTLFKNNENNAVVSIVKDEDTGSRVWNVDGIRGYAFAYQNVTFVPGATYSVSFDGKMIKTANNVTDFATRFHTNAVYIDADGKKDHIISAVTLSPADGWKHIEYTFTVPENKETTDDERFSIYANPYDGAACSFRFDNLKIERVS